MPVTGRAPAAHGASPPPWFAGRFAALVSLALWCGLALAQSGRPPVVRHEPDLEVYPQNFAVVQDHEGLAWLGNTDGLLAFDGEHWTLLPMPNGEIVRSLAVDAAGRVLVGGYNLFGMVERTPAGQARFVELTPRFAGFVDGREFADVWDIVPAPEGIYFRALRDLFFWDPASDAVAHWHHAGRFGAIAHHEGETLIQFRGEGFRRREGDDWVPLPGTASLQHLIFALAPLADGGLLAAGVDDRWWRIRDGAVAPLPMPDGLGGSRAFEHVMVMADGSIAAAAGSGELAIVPPDRSRLLRFRLDPGFLSGLAEARQGGLLVSADEALYHVAWPSAWSVLDDGAAAIGSQFAAREWNGRLHLLGSAGAMALDDRGFPELLSHWGAESILDLAPLGAQHALVAASHDLMLVSPAQAPEVLAPAIYPRQFWASRQRPGRLWLGTENGLRQVAAGTGRPRLLDGGEASGVRVASVAETSAETLWFGTDRHGVWRVTLDTDGAMAAMQPVGEAEGLAYGIVRYAHVAGMSDGSVLALTGRGLYRLHGDRFVADREYGLEGLADPERMVAVQQGPDGGLWAWSPRRLWRHEGARGWIEQPIQSLRQGGIQRLDALADGRQLLVSSQAVLVHQPRVASVEPEPPRVALRTVTRIHADGRREALPLRPGRPLVVTRGDFGIFFGFALPDFAHAGATRYQGRLRGYEADFSDWSRSRGYTYWRLRPGEYVLEVRARDARGRISEIAPWRLVIEPRWYDTHWARVAWLGLALLALALAFRAAIRRRTARLAQQTAALEAQVAERTRDLEDANRRLRAMANIDGLTGIANRRRLDEYLASVWHQQQERQRPLSVLAIDVDHFKRFNDTRGHLAGDQYLKELATRLAQCLRRSEDLLARYGGEEFLAVLPGAEAPHAREVAEAMRRGIEDAGLGATVSIGLASQVPDGGDHDALLARADAALYRAKRAGRNRVVADDDPEPNGGNGGNGG